MPFNQTRSRVIDRSTCIIDFTGVASVRSAVFDATTLTADGDGRYTIPTGVILTKSISDATKVNRYSGAGTNTNEQQTITITGTPSGGYFTLTFGGQTTAHIPYNATAAQLLPYLTALSTIGQGNLSATGGQLPGTPVVVTFINELGNMPQTVMTANGSGLSGGSAPAVTPTRTQDGSTGEEIWAIYGGPLKDFFGNTDQCDEPIPAYNAYTVFDTTLIENWDLYGELVIQALPLCQFLGA